MIQVFSICCQFGYSKGVRNAKFGTPQFTAYNVRELSKQLSDKFIHTTCNSQFITFVFGLVLVDFKAHQHSIGHIALKIHLKM